MMISQASQAWITSWLHPFSLLYRFFTYKKDCRTLYKKKEAIEFFYPGTLCIRTARVSLTPLRFLAIILGLPQLYNPWWNHMLSIYFLFLLCIAGLAASAPTIYNHPQLDTLESFPYGKLADKLLNVNDGSYYMMDDLDEYLVGVYPENHSTPFSSVRPINSFELTLPNVNTKNLFSFFYRLPDIIKKVVTEEWKTTALVRWRTMARDHSRWKFKCTKYQVSSISSVLSWCKKTDIMHI